MIEFIIEIPLKKAILQCSDLFIKKPDFKLEFNDDRMEFLAWGDPIQGTNFYQTFKKSQNIDFILNNLYGHYYFIFLNKADHGLILGNSLFSILPIYYCQTGNKLFLSHNALDLSNHIGKHTFSRRFILEMILFNYPLFNQSIMEGIYLLPANSCFSFHENRWNINKHTYIENFFSGYPVSWKQSLEHITDIFLETILKYIPDQPYLNSLTGGFDGRTLVSAGLYYRKKISCYCFGTTSSNDTEIAEQLSKEAKLPFLRIDLDESYIEKESLECGLEFIHNASGTATFSRAHYLYASKILSPQTEFIITGNFGSEIFRASHITGVLIAKNLVSIFNSSSWEDAVHTIADSNEYACINKKNFRAEWEQLIEDIRFLPCFNSVYINLSRNQNFYVFVFEELFRKYFGAEMINQFMYLKNRTPFLDIDFLKGILATGLAGVYSDFFEHNPLKRYKGQVLYAHLIRKTYPTFGKIITDKGYRPDDLISLSGNLRILKHYVRKNFNKNSSGYDPYGVKKAYETNQEYWNQVAVLSEYFDSDVIGLDRKFVHPELLYKIISLSYLLGKIITNES
jgi:asparagine synthetase B (glutamine-hydrolysing)